MKFDGNLVEICDFSLGEHSGTCQSAGVQSGALRLESGAMMGEYISQLIDCPPFESMVGSWNCDTPDGTFTELLASGRVGGEWSDFVSWGKWGRNITRSSTNDKCELVKMSGDVFTVLGEGAVCDAVRFKIRLFSANAHMSPVVRRVCATIRNTHSPIAPDALSLELPRSVSLSTPAFSQMTRDPDIGGVICSATTISVLLSDRGEQVLPEEIAHHNYDFVYEGYGNWAYSCSAAGSWGYKCYAQYMDEKLMLNELAQGRSFGLSVSYSSSKDGRFPYLENGACENTAGHLIAITGYEYDADGELWYYSSDSAATGDNSCLRKYRAAQLYAASRNLLGYVMHGKDEGAGWAAPNRIGCALQSTDGRHFRMISPSGEVPIAPDFVSAKRSRMGGGTLCYTLEGVRSPMPQGVKETCANSRFYYNLPICPDGSFVFDESVNMAPIKPGESAEVDIYAVFNSGATYHASMVCKKPENAAYIPLDCEEKPIYFEGKA